MEEISEPNNPLEIIEISAVTVFLDWYCRMEEIYQRKLWIFRLFFRKES